MGSGSTDVRNKTQTLESHPVVEHLVGSLTELRPDPTRPLKTAAAQKCGVMSEQSADSGRGNEQVPQQLVQLVGYRDPAITLPRNRPPR